MSGHFDVKFGNWVPDDPEFVTECQHCEEPLEEGMEVLITDDDLVFCDRDCYTEWLSHSGEFIETVLSKDYLEGR